MKRVRLRLPGRSSLYLNIALVVLIDAILFGGASRIELIPPLIVRIVAMIAIVWMIWRTPIRGWRIGWIAGVLLFSLILLPVVQLIPLPWSVWTHLPGRKNVMEVYLLLGQMPAHAISLTPDRTINGLAALLPAVAGFMVGWRVDRHSAGIVFAVVLVLAIISATIGLIQVAEGPNSALYFYAITNHDLSVGFFSNANHQALFLCSATVIALFMRAELVEARPQYAVAGTLAAVTVVGLLLVSILATQSRAGIALSALAIVGGIAVGALRTRRGGYGWKFPVAVLAAVIAVVALYFVGDAMFVDSATAPDLRVEYLPIYWRIIGDYFPFGSGLGSFDPVFRTYETPEILNFTYLNNAHNDYAQILIETGIFGLVPMIAFFARWAFAFISAWAPVGTRPSFGARAPRVAALITLLLIIHSAVDYPLRTAALSTLFAFCMGVMVKRRGGDAQAPTPSLTPFNEVAESDVADRDTSAAALVKRLPFRAPSQ